MRITLICLLVSFSISSVLSQEKVLFCKNKAYVLDSIENLSYQYFVRNPTKDTIFYFHNDGDTVYLDQTIFYVNEGKSWARENYSNNLKENGKFKKRRYRGLFRMPVKYFKYRKNKFLFWECKKYYGMVKVGRWEYFNKEKELVLHKIYDRDGFDITRTIQN